MLSPNHPSGSAVQTPSLIPQTSQPEASAFMADRALAILKDPKELALTLACQVGPGSKPEENSVLAPAVIGPVASLAVLDKTQGTQSAVLCSLFQDPNPLSLLTRRVEKALEGTGQKYAHLTSVLVRDASKSVVEEHYRQHGIDQEVVSLTPAAVAAENRRITEVTNGTIQGSLQTDSRAIFALVDAQYLKLKWAFPFDYADTKREIFTSASGQKRPVSTMSQRFSGDRGDKVYFTRSIGLQAVRLPYVSAANAQQQLSMLVVMKTDASLTQPGKAEVEKAIEQLEPTEPGTNIELFLPEFRIKQKTDLLHTFQHLGIREALTQDQEKLPGASISAFTQECLLQIDELGTEAAAVSLMEIDEGLRWNPSPRYLLKFDRPFSVFVCLEDKAGGHTPRPEDFLFAAHVNRLPA
ncbi:MAG: serpin family protein [Kistimonas sp.]|nr:serpin family protein [Kistimonas sp.]